MNCKECQINFEYFDGEEAAYQKNALPSPKVCHKCRQKRRMAFRNEKKLYYNKSQKSGKQIIALYPPDSPFKIIDQDEWWDDSFDATIYGRDFDFTKPFFEQFRELMLEVPRWSRMFLNCVNSDFTNNCANLKDSYLAFSCHDGENIYYSVRTNRSNSCIDCFNVASCEYCSSCIDCEKSYNTHYSQLADNCVDSYFLYDCRGAKDCILCVGVRNGQYMILNKKYTKYEYEELKKDFLKRLPLSLNQFKGQLEDLKLNTFHRNLQILNSENCLGDFIVDSRNVQNGYSTTNSEDCVNVYNCDRIKNCYDNFCMDKSELCLECDTSYEAYNSLFSTYFVGSKGVSYIDQCFFLEESFGCIGLKKRKHMILNKQYSKEEYEKMIQKITEHMKKTGEFGSPLPSNLSSFAYNDTVAFEEYPLTKEQALAQGYIWHDEKQEAVHFGKKYEIPEDIEDVDESICDKILTCEVTGQNYKIIPQELRFYKKFKLPLPRTTPDQRYRELLKLQNKKAFIDITCHFCRKPIKTTYSKEKNYKIVCEECYLKAIK